MIKKFGRSLLKLAGLYAAAQDLRIVYQDRKIIKQWDQEGRPIPPPSQFKYAEIKRYARIYNPPIFVETGTYHGGSIAAVAHLFDEVHSVELSEELFWRAKERFKDSAKIKIYHGDSTEILPKILKTIDKSILFWLDGHYSGGETALGSKETPIAEELKTIQNSGSKGDVILVDDAREFTGERGYPSLQELHQLINSWKDKEFSVQDDIIRIVPRHL